MRRGMASEWSVCLRRADVVIRHFAQLVTYMVEQKQGVKDIEGLCSRRMPIAFDSMDWVDPLKS